MAIVGCRRKQRLPDCHLYCAQNRQPNEPSCREQLKATVFPSSKCGSNAAGLRSFRIRCRQCPEMLAKAQGKSWQAKLGKVQQRLAEALGVSSALPPGGALRFTRLSRHLHVGVRAGVAGIGQNHAAGIVGRLRHDDTTRRCGHGDRIDQVFVPGDCQRDSEVHRQDSACSRPTALPS